jgi:hypothetical protein
VSDELLDELRMGEEETVTLVLFFGHGACSVRSTKRVRVVMAVHRAFDKSTSQKE